MIRKLVTNPKLKFIGIICRKCKKVINQTKLWINLPKTLIWVNKSLWRRMTTLVISFKIYPLPIKVTLARRSRMIPRNQSTISYLKTSSISMAKVKSPTTSNQVKTPSEWRKNSEQKTPSNLKARYFPSTSTSRTNLSKMRF